MPMDRSKYPDNWEKISLRIKERAGWRCECEGICGINHSGRCQRHHGDWFYLNGGIRNRNRPVVLTVAHLDHDPSSDDETRMLAMCERCHLKYDADHHRKNASATRARKEAVGTEPLFQDWPA